MTARRWLLVLLMLLFGGVPELARAQVSGEIVITPPPPPPLPFFTPPHVYIRQRIRWHRRPRVVVVAPPVIAQALPPVYIAPPPPPPVYVGPAPVYVPPPVYYAPPPPVEVRVAAPQKPGFSARTGLGFRASGLAASDGWSTLGLGGELLYRASRHWATEFAAEYQKNTDGPIDRRDIPVTFGLRLHIGAPDWPVSPYFVAAGGLDFANQDLRVAQDRALFLEGQLGGGVELRLGRHFALSADVRWEGRRRLNDPAPAVVATRSLDGKPVHALSDQTGAQFRLAAAVYF